MAYKDNTGMDHASEQDAYNQTYANTHFGSGLGIDKHSDAGSIMKSKSLDDYGGVQLSAAEEAACEKEREEREAARKLMEKGNKLFEEGNFSEALKNYQQAKKIKWYEVGDVHYRTGYAYLKLGNKAEALKCCYFNVSNPSGSNRDAYYGIAALAELGEYKNALEFCDWQLRSNFRNLKPDMRQQIFDVAKAAEQKSFEGHVYDILGECYNKGCGVERDEKTALEYFRKADPQTNSEWETYFAPYRLYEYYYYGKGGLDVDKKEAKRLLKIAKNYDNIHVEIAERKKIEGRERDREYNTRNGFVSFLFGLVLGVGATFAADWYSTSAIKGVNISLIATILAVIAIVDTVWRNKKYNVGGTVKVVLCVVAALFIVVLLDWTSKNIVTLEFPFFVALFAFVALTTIFYSKKYNILFAIAAVLGIVGWLAFLGVLPNLLPNENLTIFKYISTFKEILK